MFACVQYNKIKADKSKRSEGGQEMYKGVHVCWGDGMDPLYACQLSPRTRLP